MSNNSDHFAITFFQGQFVDWSQAKVSIATNALQYGTAVFAGLRGYFDQDQIHLLRLADHYQRFLNSLKILGVKLPYDRDQLIELTIELVERNRPQTDCYIRPFAYAAETKLSPNLAATDQFDLAMYMIPLGDYVDTSAGLQVCVSSWVRIHDNQIPPQAKINGGYINSALARKEAFDRGFDEAIFLNRYGRVCEGSAENIFLVRQGQLITPPISEDILEGITRRTLIELAEAEGISVIERPVNRTELYLADELFFSGTGAKVAWIKSVDGRKIGTGKIGPITQKLKQAYHQLVTGKHAWSAKLCTTVKLK